MNIRKFISRCRIKSIYISFTALSTIPLFMFLYNKSASTTIVVSALMHSLNKNKGNHLLCSISKSYADRTQRLGISIFSAIFAYLFATALAAPDPIRSLDILAGVFIVLLASYIIIHSDFYNIKTTITYCAFLFVVFCSAAIIVEEIMGMHLHTLLGVRSEAFALKRTALCNTLLFLSLLPSARHHFRLSIIILAWLLLCGAIAAAHSGAAAFGLVGFGLAAASARIAGSSVAKSLCLIWVAGCLAVAPILGTWANKNKDSMLVSRLHAFHLKERIEIWNAFNILARDRPIIGYGFGSSQEIVDDRSNHYQIEPEVEFARNIHPHNAYIQIWVEFGAVGACISFALMAWLFQLMVRNSPDFGAALGQTMFCCFVMLLSHSLWQPWWIASIAASVLWLKLGEAQRSALNQFATRD